MPQINPAALDQLQKDADDTLLVLGSITDLLLVRHDRAEVVKLVSELTKVPYKKVEAIISAGIEKIGEMKLGFR